MCMINRGITASELIKSLQKLVDEYGDVPVYQQKNGNIRPIYFAEYYKLEKHIELT